MLKEFIQKQLHINIKSDIRVTGLADSTNEGTVCFLDNLNFLNVIINNKNVVAVMIRKKDIAMLPENIEGIVVDSPKAVFFDVHNAYCSQNLRYEANDISPSAKIHPSAVIADKGVMIKDNVTICANTTILSGVQIGRNTTIGPNCVIGYEGFHPYTDTTGIQRLVTHDGRVIIGNNVDIHASVMIDKGLMGRDTIVSDECKIDNLCHIAHRVFIGKKTRVAAGACIAGSTDIGENVWIGPHAVIANRISICDNARVLIGSVVIRNIKRPINVSGNFAVEHIKHLKSQC